MNEIARPRPTRRLLVVLTPEEVARIPGIAEGERRLFAPLPYGTGMRISECLQLRVKDVDFEHAAIIVREGKGARDRALMLPPSAWLRPCASNWFGPDRCVPPTTRLIVAGWRRPTRWSASIHTSVIRWLGLGCSRSAGIRSIHALVWCAAIICMTRLSSVISRARCRLPASRSQPRLIP